MSKNNIVKNVANGDPDAIKKRPDSDIKSEITEKIKADQTLHEFVNTITVSVLNGLVELKGFVQTEDQADTLEDIAYYTEGVNQISNNLDIEEGGVSERSED